MKMNQAAQAPSNVISRKGITDSWKPELRSELITHDDNIVDFVPRESVRPVDYRPCADIVGPLWEKLDKLTQEWASAMLTDRRDPDRMFKMVTNAIYAMTSCEYWMAENLAANIKSCVYYFSDAEIAAVRRDWHEGLQVGRRITLQSPRNL